MIEERSYDLRDLGLRLPGRHLGFTLIELMVGMAIISMVLLFVVPSVGSWIQSSRIRNAAESIQNALQLARAEAVSRNTSVQLVFPSLASGGTDADWVVSCVNTIANANCPGPAVTLTTPSPTNRPYIQQMWAREGASGAQVVTIPASTSTIIFNGLGRVSSVAAGSTLTLNISNPNGGTCAESGGTMRCLRIVLTSSGQVRMCDPALPSSNPRSCS